MSSVKWICKSQFQRNHINVDYGRVYIYHLKFSSIAWPNYEDEKESSEKETLKKGSKKYEKHQHFTKYTKYPNTVPLQRISPELAFL